MELTLDDVKGVVGSLVLDSIAKDKKIAELTAEIERLRNDLNGSRSVSSMDATRAGNDLRFDANSRALERAKS